jgi:hypothetical protein
MHKRWAESGAVDVSLPICIGVVFGANEGLLNREIPKQGFSLIPLITRRPKSTLSIKPRIIYMYCLDVGTTFLFPHF